MQTSQAKFDLSQLRPALANSDRFASIPSWDEPEAEMVVSFEGLTEAEQRAALASFPGGRRFRLVRFS